MIKKEENMGAVKIVNLVLDCILVGLITFIIARNCINGFIKSLVSLLKTFVAPFIAIVFNLPLARLISKLLFTNMSIDFVRGWLLSTEATVIDGVTYYDVAAPLEGIPKFVADFILNAGEDDWEARKLVSKHITGTFIEETGETGTVLAEASDVETLSNFLGARMSLGISIIVSFVILFVVAEIFFIIVDKLSKKLLNKAKMVKYANILLGGLVGTLIAYALCCSIGVGVEKVFDFGQHYYGDSVFKSEYVSNTLLLKFFVKHNMWDFIVAKFPIG